MTDKCSGGDSVSGNQPVAEANIAITKLQEQPQAVAEVQHGEPPQEPNDGQQQEAQLANSR